MASTNRERLSDSLDTLMQNGTRLLVIRILSSAVLCAMIISLAAFLISRGKDIPAPWWVIGGLAIGGVVGADIITSYFSKGETKK